MPSADGNVLGCLDFDKFLLAISDCSAVADIGRARNRRRKDTSRREVAWMRPGGSRWELRTW